MEVNDRDLLFLAQMKGLHKMWKPNLGFFILRHLKEVTIETRKELAITIGAYVTLSTKYLKTDIYEEKVQGNLSINLTYLMGLLQEEDGSPCVHPYGR